MANNRGVKLKEVTCTQQRKSCSPMTFKFAIARSTALLYLKFLLITQHEVPFINTSEATKRSSDPKENGKCTNVTNRKSRVD